MSKNTFRPAYFTQENINVDDTAFKNSKRYVSPIGYGGDATKYNPDNKMDHAQSGNYFLYIMANGMYRRAVISPWNSATSNQQYQLMLIGQDMLSTVMSPVIEARSGKGPWANNIMQNVYLKDLTLVDWDIYSNAKPGYSCKFYFYNCCLKDYPRYDPANTWYLNVKKSIVHYPNNSANHIDNGLNSYLNTDIVNIINPVALYDNCNVTLVSQSHLNAYLDTWAAFNNCKFRLGTEADWTALVGETEEELRADFVSRWQVQGISVPGKTDDWDTNLPMYRWVFAKNAARNGMPVKDGIIHNFEKRKYVLFGYESKRDGFTVSSDATVKSSFNPGAPNSNLEFNGSLTIPSDIDTTNRIISSSQSNIKWLGGKKKLTDFNVIHNMPVEYGIMIDDTSTIDFDNVSSGNIQPGELYLVRSTDKQYAAITYNGVDYNTSLLNKAQVFKGVAGQAAWSVKDGNPVIYRLTDFVQHQTVEMRIVNKLPADIIKTGSLLVNYWYFVEHDTDQKNTTDFITYGNKKYYTGSSFLVQSGVTTFTATGNIHLRRAWNDDFNFDTETVDKEFWRYEQKPEWFQIVLGDIPSCFMTANSNREAEMRRGADGKYLTNGHPEFYGMEMDAGLAVPSFPIQGSYLQLRLTMTTTNPM